MKIMVIEITISDIKAKEWQIVLRQWIERKAGYQIADSLPLAELLRLVAARIVTDEYTAQAGEVEL